MDPLSQGTLGAILSGSLADRQQIRTAAWLGCLGGLAPDIDVFFQSPTDPLLFLEFHRQFTHSLAFIPAGAFLCALVAWPLAKRHLSFRQTWFFSMLGYATHGLLDACTTYGTQLFWPFSTTRFAWNNISIIDPLFTLPLLILVVTGVYRRNRLLPRIAMVWALSYLALGVIQRERAEAAGYEIAASRGHEPVRLEAKPGFATLLLWKIVYEVRNEYHVDAVHVGIDTRVYPGAVVEKLDLKRHVPWLNPDSQQARDVERFRWFSNDYLAIDPEHPDRIIDIRYSLLPDQVNALWGIILSEDAARADHVAFFTERETSGQELGRLWKMITGR